MKNKLLAILIMGILVLTVTGCGKTKTLKKIEVKGPRVVCTSTSDDGDGIKVDTTITLKFNSDNFVNYQLRESTTTFKDKKVFDSYAKAMEDSLDLGEHVEYDYVINKKKMQISTYMLYKESLFDYSKLSDEEKADYKAAVILKSAEDSGETCKFIETTKSEVGIE